VEYSTISDTESLFQKYSRRKGRRATHYPGVTMQQIEFVVGFDFPVSRLRPIGFTSQTEQCYEGGSSLLYFSFMTNPIRLGNGTAFGSISSRIASKTFSMVVSCSKYFFQAATLTELLNFTQ